LRVYELTVQEKELLKAIAKQPATYYDLYLKQQVGSSSFVWKTLKKLGRMGLIEIKKEVPFSKIKGKSKRYWGLTFKGLLVGLKYGVVKPANALEAENKNQVTLPFKAPCYGLEYGMLLDKPAYPHECQLLKKFKNEHPEIFYQIASALFQEQTEDLNALCCATVFLGSAYLYLNDEKFYAKCVQKEELSMGCLNINVGFDVIEPMYTLRPSEMFLKILGIKTKSVADLPDDNAEVVKLLKKHGLFTDRMKEFCKQLSIEY
jgi:hypothetical protein